MLGSDLNKSGHKTLASDIYFSSKRMISITGKESDDNSNPQDLSPVTPDINQKVKEKNQSFHNDKSIAIPRTSKLVMMLNKELLKPEVSSPDIEVMSQSTVARRGRLLSKKRKRAKESKYLSQKKSKKISKIQTLKQNISEKKVEYFYAPYSDNYMWMMENNVKGMTFEEEDEDQTYLWTQITKFICESKGNAFKKIVEKKVKKTKSNEENDELANLVTQVNNYQKSSAIKSQHKSQLDLAQSPVNKFAIPVLKRKETMSLNGKSAEFNFHRMGSIESNKLFDGRIQKLHLASTISHSMMNDSFNGNMTIRESDHETGQDTTKSIKEINQKESNQNSKETPSDSINEKSKALK